MIKNYNIFLFENFLEEIENMPLVADAEILESIVVDSDMLMNTVNAEPVDFVGEPFNFDIRKYDDNYTLEQLRDNADFNENLAKKELFISELQNTKDYDTYIIDDIKYLLIHKRKNRKMDKLEKLDDPLYVIFQTKDINGEWNRDKIKIYKINGNFSNFYEKLSSKTIELVKGDKKYIYISNGQNWILKNIENKDEIFKDILSNDDIKVILKENGITITIVS